MKPAAALALLALAATPASAADVNFDSFLGGIERCEPTDAFHAFYKASRDKFANDFDAKKPVIKPGVTLPLPETVRAGVGEGAPTIKREYTEVVFPLTGTFRGLPVKSLALDLGSENGIAVMTIHFSAPKADVARAFRSVVADANRKARAKKSIITAGLGKKASESSLYCNMSD